MFEDWLKDKSGEIWKKFKPYFKDKPLSDKEVDEVIKIGHTEKYARPEGDISDPKIRNDPSYWKSAEDFYTGNYIYLLIATIERHDKELRK